MNPTQSGGRIETIILQLTPQSSTPPVYAYSIPSLRGNAFEIVSSPLPLLVRTQNTSEQYYAQGQGEATGKELVNITLTSEPLYIDQTKLGPLKVRIWVGYMDYIGPIDHRILPSPIVQRQLWPVANNTSGAVNVTNGLITLPAGASIVSAVIGGAQSALNSIWPSPMWIPVGYQIENTTAGGYAQLVDENGFYLCGLYYGQVMRINVPMCSSPLYGLMNENIIFFNNPGAAACTLGISIIFETSQFYSLTNFEA